MNENAKGRYMYIHFFLSFFWFSVDLFIYKETAFPYLSVWINVCMWECMYIRMSAGV